MAIEEIRTVPFGFVNGYVLKSDGNIVLVDTGIKGKFKKVERTLASMGYDCTDISLVILTHTHHDHTGNVAECAKTSGAHILVHQNEAESLRTGNGGMPAGATGLGRVVMKIGSALGMKGGSFESVEPDIVLEGENADSTENKLEVYQLHPHGFSGVAVHTPSHSSGSISIVSDDGVCFPGDIMFNIFPASITPPVANNPDLLSAHWKTLLDRGAQIFYPGHGKPFGRERVEEQLPKVEKLFG